VGFLALSKAFASSLFSAVFERGAGVRSDCQTHGGFVVPAKNVITSPPAMANCTARHTSDLEGMMVRQERPNRRLQPAAAGAIMSRRG
jgi:hypothetical protein